MNVSVVILVGVAAAGVAFLLGFWVGLLVRPKNDAAGTPPVMSRREVQELRETVIAMEAQIEGLERQVKDPGFRRNQVR
jgi:hypothetical protein